MTIKQTMYGLIAGIILTTSVPAQAANLSSVANTVANALITLTKRTATAAVLCAGAYGCYKFSLWYFSTTPARNLSNNQHIVLEVGGTPPTGQTYNRSITLHYRNGTMTRTVTVQAYVAIPNNQTEKLFIQKTAELMTSLPRELAHAQ